LPRWKQNALIFPITNHHHKKEQDMNVLEEMQDQEIVSTASVGIARTRRRLQSVAALASAGAVGATLPLIHILHLVPGETGGNVAMLFFVSYPATVAALAQIDIHRSAYDTGKSLWNTLLHSFNYAQLIIDEAERKNWVGFAMRLFISWMTLGLIWSLVGLGIGAWAGDAIGPTATLFLAFSSAYIVSIGNALYTYRVLRITSKNIV
jgi:hypothetical protein